VVIDTPHSKIYNNKKIAGLYVGPTAPAPTYAPVDSYATLKSVPAAIPTDTVTAFEFEGFVLSKARDLLERRPIYDVVLQTPEVTKGIKLLKTLCLVFIFSRLLSSLPKSLTKSYERWARSTNRPLFHVIIINLK